MFRVDEVKPQNLTYKNPQVYKDYGTFQTHPYLSPSIWEQKLKNETKCLWLSGSESHRKARKDWIPQLWSPILSLLNKNHSLLPHAVGLPEGNTGTAGHKGRARKTLWLQLQTTEAGFPGSNGLWYFMQQKWGGRGGEWRCTEVKRFISLDKSHTLFYILAFLHECKDIETRMFVSIIL